MKNAPDRVLRLGRRFVLALLLLAATSGAVLATVAGAADGEPETRLELTVDRGFDGFYAFTLLCDPPGGNVPDPAAACAALELRPELATTKSAPGAFPFHHGPSGQTTVRVNGVFAGQQVSTTFCFQCDNSEFVGAWSVMLRIPDFPLQLQPGRSFTKPLVFGSGKAGVRIRYRKGAGFAIQFPLKNVGSVPIIVTGAGSHSQWPTPADPYIESTWNYVEGAPQLLWLTGLQLTPASPDHGLTPPPLSPTNTGRRTPYTIQPGATVWIQEHFTIAGCKPFRPGRRYIYNKEITLYIRVPHHATGGKGILLPGYQIALNAPTTCS